MPTCPHCNEAIVVRELPHPSVIKNFRICPACGGTFTVDSDTKRRQAMFLVLAVVSLILTCLLYYKGNAWLAPSLVSYVVLAGVLYWANKQVRFVPYDEESDSHHDG